MNNLAFLIFLTQKFEVCIYLIHIHIEQYVVA